MDFDTLAKKARRLAYEGKDYDAITSIVPTKQLSPLEQKELRSLINDFIVQYNLAEQVKNKYRTQILLGAMAFFLGVFILLFTYLRNENGYTFGLIVVLIGGYITKKGYDQYIKPVDFQDI
ncbi:MAG: hypothetical protein AAF960_22695, partial [Bacteroidota bacterium]